MSSRRTHVRLPHVPSTIIAERPRRLGLGLNLQAPGKNSVLELCQIRINFTILLQNVNDVPHRGPLQSQTRPDTMQSFHRFPHQRSDLLLPHLQLPIFRQLALQRLAHLQDSSAAAPVDPHRMAKAESGMPTSLSVGALVEVGSVSNLIPLHP